ncbi:hypothetical protein KC887_08340 [Candidatus Kaiserbacteria bacterium]|nr:hypothetical protein [Candidatus Kaiserbacteria bacterium]
MSEQSVIYRLSSGDDAAVAALLYDTDDGLITAVVVDSGSLALDLLIQHKTTGGVYRLRVNPDVSEKHHDIAKYGFMMVEEADPLSGGSYWRPSNFQTVKFGIAKG